MTTIWELMGIRKSPTLTPKSYGVKTGEEIERVELDMLERMYMMDPTLFNGVNIYTKMVLTQKPDIVCTNEREQKIMNDFRKRTRLDTLVMPSMVQHMCIYGKAWDEKVYNTATKPEDKILVKLDPMDPKFMDFRRNEVNQLVIWDKNGDPESYVQYLRFDIPTQPNEITQNGRRAILFEKYKILYTPLYTVGDSWDGIGLVEPAYNSARRKFDVLQGIANSTKRLGGPLVGLKVGTDRVFPTQEMIDKAVEEFRKLDEKSTVGYPNYVEPTILESKNIGKIGTNAKVFNDEEITALGLPTTLVTGSGERENRSTLEMQMILVFQTMGMIQNRISINMEDQVFNEFAEHYGFNEVPQLVWADPSETFMKRVEKIAKFLPQTKVPEGDESGYEKESDKSMIDGTDDGDETAVED